jgi:hypothetical protein
VNRTASAPPSTACFICRSVSSRSVRTYSCHHKRARPLPSRSSWSRRASSSSSDLDAAAEMHCGMPVRAATSSTFSSPSGWAKALPPVGAKKRGRSAWWPKRGTEASTEETALRTRGKKRRKLKEEMFSLKAVA